MCISKILFSKAQITRRPYSKTQECVFHRNVYFFYSKTYGDKRLRGLLALNLHRIFKEKAPLTYLGLCQHYGVDARRLEADASSGLVPKVKAKSGLEKMSDSVKRMFTHHTEEKILFIDTVENIVTLLTRLEDGSLSIDNKKAIYLALRGVESKNLERLTPSLKKELTRSLILKLDVQQMREILDDFPEINQNSNNDRIAGQLRALALDNRAALARIVAMLSMADMLADLSANTKASTVKLLRKLEVKKMSPGEVAMLYEVLFNKASDTSATAEKSLSLIKKRLVEGLVTPIHTVNPLRMLGNVYFKNSLFQGPNYKATLFKNSGMCISKILCSRAQITRRP